MSIQPGSTGHPSVDVVIATHDRPEMLRTALKAVLNQTYEGPINCIVVFDRSEPDRAVEQFSPKRTVSAMTNTRTPGLAGARNSGIAAGDSPYVAFCDDDDEWLPDKISRQIAALAGSDALTSVTGIIVRYADHEVARVPRQSDLTLDNLVRNRVMEAHPSSVLVRRHALESTIGLVDEEIPGSHGEDFDWIIRAAKAGKFAVVEAPLVRVFWGQSQFSQNWQVIIDATDYWLNKHAAFHEDQRAFARLYGQRSFALAALGRRGEALRSVARTFRASPRELRSYLAIAVAFRLVSAERLMHVAHSRGHGI